MKRNSFKKQTKSTKKDSKVIFEDKHTHGKNGAIFRIINDKDQPFYKYEFKEMEDNE